jgi:segregation and condensation protein A
VMAAMLAEIKSRMLLPRQEEFEDEEGDPRAELIRRLQEYERYKQAAEDIDALPRMGRDLFQAEVDVPDRITHRRPPDVDLRELLMALNDVMKRADMFTHHQVQMETLSVREKMSRVLESISADAFTTFTSLFDLEEGRLGVVVTFLAILELIKGSLIEMVQAELFGSIHIKAVATAEV